MGEPVITLHTPQRSLETLRALAASGHSGLAKAAQRELRDRVNAALRKAVAS